MGIRGWLHAAAVGLLLLLGPDLRAESLPAVVLVAPPAPGKGAVVKIIDGLSCATPTCETPPFSVFTSDSPVLQVDCSGTCRVTLVCRPPGSTHDFLLADSGSLTNAGTAVAVQFACPYTVARFTVCTSGTCVLRAWGYQL